MPEPIAVVTAFAKLATSLSAVVKAAADGSLDSKDVDAWSSLASSIRSARESLASSTAEADDEARLISVCLAAFSAALRDHWAGSTALAPRMTERTRWVTQATTRELQVQCALRGAFRRLQDWRPARDEQLLKGDPAASTAYQALWDAFLDNYDEAIQELASNLGRSRPEAGNPLIQDPPSAKARFESQFRYQFRTLSARQFASFHTYADSLWDSQKARCTDITLGAMAAWEERSIFGQLNEQIGALPLGDIYVEPAAQSGDDKETAPRPILALLKSWLTEGPSVQVVLGDFGLGKSLSARMLCCDLAQALLGSSNPTHTSWMPVYVPSADVLEQRALDLPYVLRRSKWMLLQESGISVGIDDDAVAPPDAGQRTLIVFDGLDERALTQAELESFFRRLIELSADNRRFLVFSRPAILDSVIRRLPQVHVATLLPFDTEIATGIPSRVEQWLNRWNRLVRSGREPITIEKIADRGLLAEAGTPVVLFVIAFAWDASTQAHGNTRSVLYDSFLRRVARGKLPEGGERHTAIEEAAKELRDHLVEKQRIAEGATGEDAVLWTLSALAWQSHCCDQQLKPSPLTRAAVDEYLRKELHCRDLTESVSDLIVDGVLLALQHGSTRGSARMLYGHKSFREYLVAKYWDSELARAVRDANAEVWDGLRGGLLDIWQDAATTFLEELLRRWSQENLRSLLVQAQQQFTSDIIVAESGHPKLSNDRRIEIRHSAMVVHCLARRALKAAGEAVPPPLVVSEATALPSLTAGLLVKRRRPDARIWLQGARIQGVHLDLVQARSYWFLDEASLESCILSGDQFTFSWFSGMKMQRGGLFGSFFRCDFSDAQFEATGINAGFFNCNFKGARFDQNCTAASTRFTQCDFVVGAQLPEAIPRVAANQELPPDFQRIRFVKCNFGETPDFYWADLSNVTFLNCRLPGASFVGAKLKDTRFEKCDLRAAVFPEVSDSSVRFKGCRGRPVKRSRP